MTELFNVFFQALVQILLDMFGVTGGLTSFLNDFIGVM